MSGFAPLERLKHETVVQRVPSRRDGREALPDALRTRIEGLSGIAMDDVAVYRNSPIPARINAHAFTQGTDIHVAPGQDRHLPHEAWHVVQQKQGRVIANRRLDSGIAVNSDLDLEREADAMAMRAPTMNSAVRRIPLPGRPVMQRVLMINDRPIGGIEGLKDCLDTDIVEGIIFKTKSIHPEKITDQEIDNAIRSVTYSIEFPKRKDQYRAFIDNIAAKLSDEININKSYQVEACTRLIRDIHIPAEVADSIVEQLGSQEALRLFDIIRILWTSGQVSSQHIVEMLQSINLAHDHLADFTSRLDELTALPPAEAQLGFNRLGKQPIAKTTRISQDSHEFETFTHDIKTMAALAETGRYNPLAMVDNPISSRFREEGSVEQQRKKDADIISNDRDFNLRQDLDYMALLEHHFNMTVSGPQKASRDSQLLRDEMERMAEILSYKISYISIMTRWSGWMVDIRTRVDNELDAARTTISKLEKQREDLQKELRTKKLPEQGKMTRGFYQKRLKAAQRIIDGLKDKIVSIENSINLNNTILYSHSRKIKKEQKILMDDIASFLDADSSVVNFLLNGILMLPSRMRMAGIFPSREAIRITSEGKAGRYDALTHHAYDLVEKYGLYAGKMPSQKKGKPGRQGLISNVRAGCVCIMYIKEGRMKDPEGASFRPVFGAAGVDSYAKSKREDLSGLTISDSYANMGDPSPYTMGEETSSQTRQRLLTGKEPDGPPLISYDRAQQSLRRHVDDMKRLGIKPPSMQSQLYFLQTPEYRANQLRDTLVLHPDLVEIARGNTIRLLENWMPSNCAEPAIMTAIYQLYYEPKDIYLSVPFEGTLSKSGQLLLKYTCTRCATSEPAFMSPTVTPHKKQLTDMRVRTKSPESLYNRLLDPSLIMNAENTNHPYSAKQLDIIATMLKNAKKLFLHFKSVHKAEVDELIATLQQTPLPEGSWASHHE